MQSNENVKWIISSEMGSSTLQRIVHIYIEWLQIWMAFFDFGLFLSKQKAFFRIWLKLGSPRTCWNFTFRFGPTRNIRNIKNFRDEVDDNTFFHVNDHKEVHNFSQLHVDQCMDIMPHIHSQFIHCLSLKSSRVQSIATLPSMALLHFHVKRW